MKTKKMDVPEHWSETISRNNDKVTIEADLDIAFDEVANTPVVEVEKLDLNEDKMIGLVNYFADGKKLYKPVKKTKQELEQYLDKVKNEKGIYGSPDEIYWKGQMIANLTKLLESAPEQTGEKQTVEVKYSEPYQSDFSVAKNGTYREDILTEQFYFYAEVDDTVPSTIRAMREFEKADAFPVFDYKKGEYFSEEELKQGKSNLERYSTMEECNQEWRLAYQQFIAQMETAINNSILEKDAIMKEAEKILNKLDITNMALVNGYQAVWLPENHEWDSMDTDWSGAEDAYTLVYSKAVGELSTFKQNNGVVYEQLPEQSYTPPFQPEKLVVTFTKSGIVSFHWENMSKAVKIIAENTQLLNFEEIKTKLADHMLYAAIALDEINEKESALLSNRYVVKDVKLCYAHVNAYDAPQNAWLVPVWVFQMEWYLTVQGREEILREPQTVMINALEGGYVGIP